MGRVSAKALYAKYRDDSVINRLEQYAYWTLPYLMADPREVSSTGRVVVERDFQEIGALLVNSLSAKLARLLFPMQYPFFRASASSTFKRWAAEKGYDEAQLEERFAELEMQAKSKLFVNAGYAALILALKYLIVTGSALICRGTEKSKTIVWGPNSFAVKRDGSGDVLDAVLQEFTTVEALPEDLQADLRAGNKAKYGRPEQVVEKYTRIQRGFKNGVVGFRVYVEVDNLPVGDPGWYPENLCPWMFPTWTLIPGEHMGRGLVEDYAGGFAKLSSLSEAAALYGVEMTRVVHLVGPGSGADIDDLAGAESGRYVRGDPNAVKAYEAGDADKAEQVARQIEEVFSRLARAFMYTAQARQAERVTAYELRREAEEAEIVLGGSISTLSGSLQIPLAYLLISEVSESATTGIVLGEIMPDITAGIDALGRSADVQNLIQASQEIGAILPVLQLDKRIDPQRVVDAVLAGRSIKKSELFYSPEELRANQESENAAMSAQSELLKAQTLSQQGDQLQQLTGGM